MFRAHMGFLFSFNWLARNQPDLFPCSKFGKCRLCPNNRVLFHSFFWFVLNQFHLILVLPCVLSSAFPVPGRKHRLCLRI